jgi:ABC-type amino acid transport substrate-binding protein
MNRNTIPLANAACSALRAVVLPALLIAAPTVTLAAPDYGNCQVSGVRGSVKLETVVPGALSVRPALPAPGWWNGDSLETIKDGFEYCMAANMAYRAGLDRVIIVSRSFAQVLTGQAKGFDIALSQITITDERKKVVNFTEPYFNSGQGVLVKAGTKADKESIKKMRLGVRQGSTTLQYVTEKLKPSEPLKVYAENSAMYAALAANQIDAAIYDTANVLARAKQSNGAFQVVGRYDTNESWGGIVNKDSPNLPVFNKLIEDFKRDGTIDRLTQTYLTPSLGMDPSEVPDFTP